MKRTASIIVALAGAALSGAPGWAQAARTFVSGVGMDTNPCTRTAPCRGFSQAIGVTNAGGEVVALDSAGYGAFMVTKAISISAEGVEAAITATTTDGITIAAGASDVINLRSLVLTGGGSGQNGITFTSGGTLNIQNCVVRGFTNDGIHLSPANAASVNISDTIASNNAAGIAIVDPSGPVHAFFERVQATGNTNGLFFDGNVALITALVANSVVANNKLGVDVEGNASVVLSNSNINDNNTVLFNVTSLVLANSRLYGNQTGFSTSGSIKTFGNNDIADTNNTGSLTPIGQQ